MTAPAGALIHTALRYDLLIGLLTLGRERRFRERLLVPAKLEPGETVVDIGCGTGLLAIAAADHVAPTGTVIGIDPSPEMIARARGKAARKRANVRFEIGYAQQLPLADRFADVVLSTVMLHHIPRVAQEDALKDALRVLQPAGRLVLIDFGRDESGRKGLIGHIHRSRGPSARDFADLTERAGFEPVEWGPLGTFDLQFVVARRP